MHTNNEEPGSYTGFFKRETMGLQGGSADSCKGEGSEGTLISQWAPAEKRGGSPKRLPTGTKKAPA